MPIPIPPMWFIFPVSFFSVVQHTIFFLFSFGRLFIIHKETNFLCCAHSLCCVLRYLRFPFSLQLLKARAKKKQLCSFMSTTARSHRWLRLEAHTFSIHSNVKGSKKEKKITRQKENIFASLVVFFIFVSSLFCFLKPASLHA